MPVHCQGLSAACNERHFLDFDILVIYHFNSAYLRFYWRYLNNFGFVRNLISSSKIWLKNLIFWKIRHEPHFDRAPHKCVLNGAQLITLAPKLVDVCFSGTLLRLRCSLRDRLLIADCIHAPQNIKRCAKWTSVKRHLTRMRSLGVV